jgi:hypothetical protein
MAAMVSNSLRRHAVGRGNPVGGSGPPDVGICLRLELLLEGDGTLFVLRGSIVGIRRAVEMRVGAEAAALNHDRPSKRILAPGIIASGTISYVATGGLSLAEEALDLAPPSIVGRTAFSPAPGEAGEHEQHLWHGKILCCLIVSDRPPFKSFLTRQLFDFAWFAAHISRNKCGRNPLGAQCEALFHRTSFTLGH